MSGALVGNNELVLLLGDFLKSPIIDNFFCCI
jgi:hypothetical protein